MGKTYILLQETMCSGFTFDDFIGVFASLEDAKKKIEESFSKKGMKIIEFDGKNKKIVFKKEDYAVIW